MINWNKINIYILYYKIMWIFAVGAYILIPLKSSLIQYIYLGIHIVTYGIFSYFLINVRFLKLSLFNLVRLLLIALLFIVIVFSAWMSSAQTSFSTEIAGIIGFLEMIIAVFMVDFNKDNEQLLDFTLKINIIIAVVFIVLSRSSYAYSGRIEGSLYLGYSNPNATAIYLLLNMAILICLRDRLKKFYQRFLILCISIYLIYLIYLTDSRTCLIAALFIVLYNFIGIIRRFPRWVIVIAFFIPLGFLFVYAFLYYNGYFLDLEILGKPFYSGREEYFIEMLFELKQNFVLGDVGEHYFTNMHNGSLTILSSIGVLGYILYAVFILYTLLYYRCGIKNKSQVMALITIIAVFIHSSAEAALVVGGAHYSIIIAFFYLMLKGNKQPTNNKQ